MANYKRGNNSFINPYNFIPVKKDLDRDYGVLEDHKKDNLYSGYIDCEIEVMTPLVIPDTAAEEDTKKKGHYIYPFFAVDSKPIIPGSTIRGEIRSVYETLTDSCMSTLQPNTSISTRYGFDNSWNIKSGLLFKEKSGKWKLYKAKRYGVVINGKNYKKFQTNNKEQVFSYDIDEEGRYIYKKLEDNNSSEIQKIRYGDIVYFSSDAPIGHKKGNNKVWEGTVDEISIDYRSDLDEGYAYVGETFSARKHAESIFKKTGTEAIKTYSEEELKKCLDDSVKEYQDKAVNRNLNKTHTGYMGYDKAREKGVLPVWYREEKEGDRIYLSMAAIGRIQYDNTVNKLAHSRCEDRGSLCKACALFGMVATNKKEENNHEHNKGLGSHIRITDAKCTESKLNTQYTTLKELGKPRPSYLPFYVNNGKEYDDNHAEIRGRKFYWHNPNAATDEKVYTTNIKTERNATHQLMGVGSIFSFRIYYDYITDSQLKELCWAIEPKGEDGKHYYHRLGHGKPLGLGSVKIGISKHIRREMSIDGKKYELKDMTNDLSYSDIVDKEDVDKEVINNLLRIMEFKIYSDEICYPYVEIGTKESILQTIEEKKKMGLEIADNVLANHQWFSENNKRTGGNVPMNLPSIEEIYNESNHLKSYYIDRIDGGENSKDFKQPKEDFHKRNYSKKTVYEVKITRVAKKGTIFFDVEGKEGTVQAWKLKGKTLKKGDIVRVSFLKEVTFDDGKKVRLYDLQ